MAVTFTSRLVNKMVAVGLAATATACQHTAPPVAKAVTQAPAATVASPEIPATQPEMSLAADSLTPEMRATLQQVNLSKLFLAPESQSAGFKMALDGFFGTNPQRLSLAILQASRDSLQPEVIHVTGKARNQKQVTNFTGEIRLTGLVDYYDQSLLLSQGGAGFIQDTTSEAGNITNARAYAASATFHFVGQAPATYALNGHAFLDFWLMDNGTVGQVTTPGEGIVLEKAATKGSGLLFKGNWQDAKTSTSPSFVVCRDVFLLSPGFIKDFGIGDRGAQVNPKYAKLGWSSYWETDEWWAESPKPKLSL
ncbi:hypothetical protein [Hymenobacter ruricola]|uniref:Uncharacterized protein n=1 Tax=Hymenobacter ruricola TaxID=2791023 RepID=A0ABS0I496_9BACT|nr:hypothetical protein [Hymenobacter ruricola]MBF9221417.1 hypothetical protein [Hymenobacter ruricola]